MANVSRVNGLRPVKHVDGSPWNGQVTRYFASGSDATGIFNGDLVKLAAVSDTQGQALLGGFNSTVGGTPGVTAFVAGTDTLAVGVAVGFMINPLNLNSPQYRTASTAMYVLVADAPDTLYEIQADTSTYPSGSAGIIPATGMTKNYNVSNTAGGSTVTGFSGMLLQTSSAATTATLPLKALGAVQKVDNDITSQNIKMLVMINNQQLSGGTGTLGV
jgi:hypothetical protein